MYVLHPYNLGVEPTEIAWEKNMFVHICIFSGLAVFPLKVLGLKQIFYDIHFRSAPFLLSRF